MHRTLAISTRTDSVVPYTTLFRSVVDPPTVVATHLNQLIAMRASEMFGLDDARKLLDNLKDAAPQLVDGLTRSEEHTSELQSLMRISYAVFCLTKRRQKRQRRKRQHEPAHARDVAARNITTS